MKKQLFSLVLLLAIVVLASTSGWAQGTIGCSPGQPDLFVVGSTGEFSVTRGEAGSTLEWKLFKYSTAAYIGVNLGASDLETTTNVELVSSRLASAIQLGDGITYSPASVAGASANKVYVKFKNTPATNYIYCLQVREIGGDNCISVRRIYLSVFDFEVFAYWNKSRATVADTAATFSGKAVNGGIVDTITWNNKVIRNTMDQTWLLGAGKMQADSVNNPTNSDKKIDSIFFAVKIRLIGAPSLYTLENLKWRFRYSFPNQSNDSIYWIHPTTAFVQAGDATVVPASVALPAFGTAPLATNTTEVDIPFESGAAQGTFAGMNEVLVPAIGGGTGVNSATYIFAMVNHQVPGGPDQVYDIRIERAELEFDETATGVNYTSGTKVNKLYATDATALKKGETGTMTVKQTPATDVITILH